VGERRADVAESLAMAGYSLLLAMALVVSAPWWLGRMFFSAGSRARYRAGLEERLGQVPAGLKEAVRGRRVVWVHAVSVGEVMAATRLVGELELALGSELEGAWRIVVSTTTATGQALARERFGVGSGAANAGRVFYYPLDFAWAVRAYLRVLRPELVVLMESEIWPRMLVECGRRGVPVAIVNARVSDRSFARGVKVRAVGGWVLRRVDLFLAQSEEDARRLVEMGAPVGSVKAIGNLKYDVRAAGGSRVAELIKEVAAGRPIVVAGSTVGGLGDKEPDEEGWLIATWGGRARNEIGAVLVLAPRHPERFEMVWEEGKEEFATVRATELLAGVEGTQFSYQVREAGDHRPEIVILNTIGDLAAVYAVADLAFVGGSLIQKGGHNPLEPAQFGVPIVMGPSYENFRDIVGTMKAAHAICITAGKAQLLNEKRTSDGLFRSEVYAMRDSLEAEMVRLLTDRVAAKAMGERGRAVFEAQSGATGRAVEALVGLVRGGDEAASMGEGEGLR
jgi:3-deoxy-D-manno-octulosonic-acid transferase